MSSFGYAIVFMACTSGGECTPVNMLLTRFESAERCRSALPLAQARLLRNGQARNLSPVCSNLDDLCKPLAIGLPLRQSLLRFIGGRQDAGPKGPLEPHLRVMCEVEQDAPAGCDG